ncbi:MAG: thioredoxin family protein [Candidatus Korarchaeota archaeon]|nr:thioredoxin family protein [Candidatus Korarchaeota archaeon]NIU82405.1 thioredoxin fold domain-containing protein [Candidatus Thorarchaeota archaeon]NIW12878.1 thioredoxin fold domain-containing protein [Candidatus Thorarchaeota archaeon]NIW51072.1 thioredoxin fold domain-containing protein [Candidatus Korarchaeota archaeon]
MLQSETPVIVDFWHENCAYCVELNPIFDELATEVEDVTFFKLNIQTSGKNFQIAQKYGIMGTPTLKFFCKGRTVGEIIGFRPKQQLKEEIKKIIENAEICLKKSTKLPKRR